jgi:hypothetical protein
MGRKKEQLNRLKLTLTTMKAGKAVFDMDLNFKDIEKTKGYPSYQVLQELSFVPVKSDTTRYYKQVFCLHVL